MWHVETPAGDAPCSQSSRFCWETNFGGGLLFLVNLVGLMLKLLSSGVSGVLGVWSLVPKASLATESETFFWRPGDYGSPMEPFWGLDCNATGSKVWNLRSCCFFRAGLFSIHYDTLKFLEHLGHQSWIFFGAESESKNRERENLQHQGGSRSCEPIRMVHSLRWFFYLNVENFHRKLFVRG